MKCDKLKAFDVIINDDYKTKCYTKADVDAAIDELKEKIDGQKWRGDEWARAANDTERYLVFKNPKIRIDNGRPEWGAVPGKLYFVITWEV